MIIPAGRHGRLEVRVRSPNAKQKLIRLSSGLVRNLRLKHGRLVSLELDEKRDLFRLNFDASGTSNPHRVSSEGKGGFIIWARAESFSFLLDGRYVATVEGCVVTIALPAGTGRKFLRTDVGKRLARGTKR